MKISKMFMPSNYKMVKSVLDLRISIELCSMQTKQGNPRPTTGSRNDLRSPSANARRRHSSLRTQIWSIGVPACARTCSGEFVARARSWSWQGLWGNQNLSQNRIHVVQLLLNLSKFNPNPPFPPSAKSCISQWSFWATALRVSTAETVHMCARDSGLESPRAPEKGARICDVRA